MKRRKNETNKNGSKQISGFLSTCCSPTINKQNTTTTTTITSTKIAETSIPSITTTTPIITNSTTTISSFSIKNENISSNDKQNINNNINDEKYSKNFVLALQQLQQQQQQRFIQQQQQQQQQQSSLSSNESYLLNSNAVTIGEEESYSCPQCYRTYRRHGTLRRHLRQECGKGKSMVCSVCGHRTKRADHLRQHVRKKHPEIAMRSLFRHSTRGNLVTSTTTTSEISTNCHNNKNLQQQQQQQQQQIHLGVDALNLKTILDEDDDIVDLATTVDTQDIIDGSFDNPNEIIENAIIKLLVLFFSSFF